MRTLKTKIHPFLLLSIFLFINGLFIIKYIPRFNIDPFSIVSAYIIVIVIMVCNSKRFFGLKKNKRTKSLNEILYFSSLFLILLSSVSILFFIDPLSTEVDRWSALTGFLEKLFNGEFPYSAQTHRGQFASPFPVLHLIAIPFYLIGDVGFLQVFFICLTSVIIFKKLGSKKAFIFIVFLFLSPSFWWEISARSDLFTNLLLVALFVFISEYKTNDNKVIYRFSVITGLLLSTRGIVIIPLVIFCIFLYKSWHLHEIIKSIFIIGIVFLLTLLPFALWDIELFIKYNPIILQTNKSPLYIQISAIAVAAILGSLAKQHKDIFIFSVYALFVLMLSSFLISLITEGYFSTIYEHNFDISYFNTALPFVLFALIHHLPAINLNHSTCPENCNVN